VTLRGRSIVAGEAVGEGSRTFRAVDPRDGQLLEPAFFAADTHDLERAVAAAVDAVRSLAPAAARAGLLESVAEALEAQADPIVARAGAETALPEGRLRGELGRATGQLRLFAGVAREGSWVDARIDTADPGRQPIPRPDVRSMLTAVGPVAIFGASNFPLAFSVAGGDTASAWAAGCPVVVKAHPAHPGTSELVARAIARAAAAVGLPAGVCSLLFDEGHEVGVELVRHPSIRAVGFTGSQRGGLALARLAFERPDPIPVYAEMGSVNPIVVLVGALTGRVDELADGLFGSCTLGVGQFCTSPGVVFLPAGGDGDRFVERVASLVRSSRLDPMLTPGIASAFAAGSDRLRAAGATLVAEGVASAEVAAPAVARLWESDVETVGLTPDLLEEVFGPSTLVVRYGELDEVVELAGRIPGQLTATIHAADHEIEAAAPAWEALARRAGRLVFGQFPTGVEVSDAMVHGGPYPATTDPRTTSVGTRAVARFARLVAYQNAPAALLPVELQDENPRGVLRLVDGTWTRDPLEQTPGGDSG